MLDKIFNSQKYENEIYEQWKDPIVSTAQSGTNGQSFTIVLPPPNITGSLHMGHAFTSTIQDILLRVKRQHGFMTLGQPGVDHAGIATQIVVDRQLANQGISSKEIGRDAFIQKVWEWKEKSGGQIINQLKRLGMSVDWDRLRFTMDEKSSKAVIKAFVTLYQDGLIYRAKKLVNWDPILKTAISDLEVTSKEIEGRLWYIRYKAVQSDEFITVATTRPETLFGDMAVAVHPDDERYHHWIGSQVFIPLIQRAIPVIADSYSDPTKGTGAVKITPAHDFNDFEVGQRHGLPILSILDEGAHLNESVPSPFQGLSCKEARPLILEVLTQQGCVEDEQIIRHAVPYNERSDAIIEPRVTNQWFLDAQKLAGPAIQAVESGAIQFIPDSWESTYFEWMRNIQPWCISRQIWWGHQIPVWYAQDGKVFCAETEEDAQIQADTYFKTQNIPLTRDPDVLDTWFSAALWPFSTQGWPDHSNELHRYPTDVLVTAFDIIFFWVARMIMFGQYFMKDIPFHHIYIHPLVRDEKGQKMSKSKGNVIDPLSLMDRYGTDALRFALAALATPGRDIKISEALVENSRNFITKIWNAARFLELNHCFFEMESDPTQHEVLQPLNAWIIQKLKEFKTKCWLDLENYRFDFLVQNIQKFLRDTFCDIYIECLKPSLGENISEATKSETRKVAAWVFTEFLNVAHPVIPFVTEHLWKVFTPSQEMLITRAWYEPETPQNATVSLTDSYVDLIQEIRSLRGLLNIQPTEKLKLIAKSGQNDDFIAKNQHWLCALGRLKNITFSSDVSREAGLHFMVGSYEFCMTYPKGVQIQDLRTILNKKGDGLRDDLQKLTGKIRNKAYKIAKPDQWLLDQNLCSQKEVEIKKIEEMIRQLESCSELGGDAIL